MNDEQTWLEACRLWREVFGDQPTVRCEPRLLFEVLVEALPSAGPYLIEGARERDAV